MKSGLNGRIELNWSCPRNIKQFKAEYSLLNSNSYTEIETINYNSSTTSTSGTYGTSSVIKKFGSNNLSLSNSYKVKIKITDMDDGVSEFIIQLSNGELILDIKANGKGIGIGRQAEGDNIAAFQFTPRFYNSNFPQYHVDGVNTTPIRIISAGYDSSNNRNANGDGILIGGGGAIIIGAGESYLNYANNSGITGGEEKIVFTSDSRIEFITNMQNGYNNEDQRQIIFNNGNIFLYDNCYLKGYDTLDNETTPICLIRATGGTCAIGDSRTQTGIWGTSVEVKNDLYAASFRPKSYASGIYMDQYGNLITSTTLNSGYWHLSNNGTNAIRINWDDLILRTRQLIPNTTNTWALGSPNYYWSTVYAQNYIASNTVKIPKNGSAGYGLCNASGNSIIRDHGNSNVTLDATGGKLYLGYQNTNGINIFSGLLTLSYETQVYNGSTYRYYKFDNSLCVGILSENNNGQSSYNCYNGNITGTNQGLYIRPDGKIITGGHIVLEYGNIYLAGSLLSRKYTQNIITHDYNHCTVGPGSGTSNSVTTYIRGNNVRLYAHNGGGVYLGSSGSTAVTSDENLKDISEMNSKYENFFMNLKPITYRYKNNGHRDHIGFGARQVEKSLKDVGLSNENFAGVLRDTNVTISADEAGTEEDVYYDELYSLRYEEFIALNTKMIQKCLNEIEQLKQQIKELKGE